MSELNSPAEEMVACETCGAVLRLDTSLADGGYRCPRCGSVLRRYRPNGRAQTAALALAALVLYIPANMYPMLTMQAIGRQTENTVWDGVVSLYHDGMWFVATIVFCASIIVPVLKILGLFFLALGGRRWPREAVRIYKIIRWLGPWAMLDVFLLAVAVALVKFGAFGTIIPGPGITAFAMVVVLTILASSCFDPRSLWTEDSA
jgi:paraquat-inducible protein A